MRRMHKWSKKVLVPLAALPVFQVAGGCDPTGITNIIVSQTLNLAGGVTQLFLASAQQVLLQSFPSADILQIFLGQAPPPPLFPG